MNPDLSFTFRPLVNQVSDSLNQERLIAMLAACFGALRCACRPGTVCGVMTYSVASRRQEIGIRMALGASASTVARLVFRAAFLVGAGILLGAAAGLWASKFVSTLIYGLRHATLAR